MAAMKQRRPTKAAPPPKPPMRLAMLQSAAPRRGGKSGRSVMAGLLLVVGASLAGAAWMGGSLVDARDAMAGVADGVLADAGFAVAEVAIEGVSGARAAEVEAAALPGKRGSLFGAEPQLIKDRVEALDWVQEARVARLWPGKVKIQVERRQAVARWRLNGREITIDLAGKPAPAAPGKDGALPLLIGADAGYAVPPLPSASKVCALSASGAGRCN
jgi:cell division protein FtsQ